MDFKPKHPPRKFPVGKAGTIQLSDCGEVHLDPDEQVTFHAASGSEYDVVRKHWGYYATPSLNRRLPRFGLRGALALGDQDTLFVLLVEEEKVPDFLDYLEANGMRLVSWLDRPEDLARLQGVLEESSRGDPSSSPSAESSNQGLKSGASRSEGTSAYNASDYEERYRAGYGLAWPESHVIRVHKHILEYELGQTPGGCFDFGCGAGANLAYFESLGYSIHGCDTSAHAIERARQRFPARRDQLFVSEVEPDLLARLSPQSLKLFFSNQVFYFLSDEAIHKVVGQALELLEPGGVFFATMMARTCWYYRHRKETSGDFDQICLDSPRQSLETWINFKDRDELEATFPGFRTLHIGSYGSQIRDEEGSTDHWIYVGQKEG